MLSYLPRAIALFALASSIGASAARADDYPSRPVKIIAPFGAGGPTDVFTRDIAEELRNALHQTFYIENRPGAGTTIGSDMVAKAEPVQILAVQFDQIESQQHRVGTVPLVANEVEHG
jgi:tripartite-type tricarboxylate transporter receptor subunit TctC